MSEKSLVLKKILLHSFFNQLVHKCVRYIGNFIHVGFNRFFIGNRPRNCPRYVRELISEKVCGLAASFIHLPVCCRYSNFQPLTTVPFQYCINIYNIKQWL